MAETGAKKSSFVVIFLPPATGGAAETAARAEPKDFSCVFRDLESGMIYHSYFITKQVIRSYFFVIVRNKKGVFMRGLLEELSKVSP